MASGPTARALPSLLSQLARAIGQESAKAEIRWMKQTLENPPPRLRSSARTLEEMVARRVSGEPLQYILGSQPFGPLNLAVRAPVLIPRPETEDWTIRLAESLAPRPPSDRPLKLLDLCTGSGCIPLLICHLWPPGSVHATGVDVSKTAVQLARENAALCGISTPDGHAGLSATLSRQSQTDLAQSQAPHPHRASGAETATGKANADVNANTFTPVLADLMHPDFVQHARLEPPYDLITSNPPYIPPAEYATLPRSVREYEDVRALVGDPPPSPSPGTEDEHEDETAADRGKGLAFYHRIAALVREHGLLSARGTLALEVGDGQAAEVAAIVERRARLGRIDVWRDPWGKERVVVARQ